MRKFKVPASSEGQRADVFVAAKFPQFSRSALERLFDEEFIKVNGKIVKASRKLQPKDSVVVDDKLLKVRPETIEIPVIYEDDDVVVMNKPAGLLTHSKGAINSEATVASFLKSKITDKNLDDNRAGIVHRLDRHTSGVIIGAKNEAALKYLQKQFSNRKTKKTYLAYVEGLMEPAEAIIDAPIARNPKNPQTFYVNVGGKPSQTQYRSIDSFKKGIANYSLVELKPTTGRTHQLRVHLSYTAHPIVGDFVYGHPGGPMLLHAQSLELTLPNRERRVFKVDTPDYFSDFSQQ